MSKGYTRCEFMSPSTGLQCEIWFESQERQHDSAGSLLPLYCPDHSNGNLETDKTQYIETKNIAREFCYQMFEKCSQEEGFNKLDAHIAKIEAEIENQKVVLYAAKAVRQEKLQNLSEDERKERLKYRVRKSESSIPTEKKETLKSNPVGYLEKRGLSKSAAQDLLTLDPDELIAKFKAAQKKKKEGNQ